MIKKIDIPEVSILQTDTPEETRVKLTLGINILANKLNEVIDAVNQIEDALSSVGEVELRSGYLYNEIPAK